MNITKIRLATGATNHDLPIVGALPTDTFIFKGADGLGPVDQELFIINTQHQGGFLQNQRAQTREVTLRIGLNPNWSVGERPEQLRTSLYGTILPRPGTVLKIQLMNNNTVLAESVGYVKRCEPAVFSKDPEMQMVVACPQPYFSAPTPVTVWPSLNNPSNFVVDNPGTAPSGFTMEIEFMQNVPKFELQLQGDSTQKLTVNKAFVTGDILLINTRYGDRAVLWSQPPAGANEDSLLSLVSPTSKWPQVHSGVNTFTISTTTFTFRPAGFSYTPRYLGV